MYGSVAKFQGQSTGSYLNEQPVSASSESNVSNFAFAALYKTGSPIQSFAVAQSPTTAINYGASENATPTVFEVDAAAGTIRPLIPGTYLFSTDYELSADSPTSRVTICYGLEDGNPVPITHNYSSEQLPANTVQGASCSRVLKVSQANVDLIALKGLVQITPSTAADDAPAPVFTNFTVRRLGN